MVCKGVSLSELEAIAAEVGVRLNQAREGGMRVPFVRFTLRPIGEGYRRVNFLQSEGQRVNAVCYHGHCAFFDLLFDRFAAATVESAKAKFAGFESYADQRDAVDEWEGNDHWGRVRYSAQCRCDRGRPTLGEDHGAEEAVRAATLL